VPEKAEEDGEDAISFRSENIELNIGEGVDTEGEKSNHSGPVGSTGNQSEGKEEAMRLVRKWKLESVMEGREDDEADGCSFDSTKKVCNRSVGSYASCGSRRSSRRSKGQKTGTLGDGDSFCMQSNRSDGRKDIFSLKSENAKGAKTFTFNEKLNGSSCIGEKNDKSSNDGLKNLALGLLESCGRSKNSFGKEGTYSCF